MADIKKFGQKLSWLLTKPLVTKLSRERAQSAELMAWLSIVAVLFSLLSFVIFPFQADFVPINIARLTGLAGAFAAYGLGRRGHTYWAIWVLILVTVQLPAFSSSLIGGTPEAIIYLHIAIVLAFSTMSVKQATLVSLLSLLLFVSTLWLGENEAMSYANIVLGTGLVVSLRIGGRAREKQLRQIEAQATQLISYEQNRQEMVRHHQQADFLKQVVTNLGHDIKTPLSIINLQAHIIENMLPDKKVKSRLDKISVAVGQIDTVIENLRQLNRASDSIELPMEQLDLNELIRDSRDGWWQGASNHVDLLLSHGTLMIEGNRDSMRLAISLLVDNAFVHSTADVNVTLATGLNDNGIIFSITDTGPGISKHEQMAIFDFFYKVDKARTDLDSGPGLGLPIAKQIVENHGGQIKIYSDLGRGTQITVSLPQASYAVVA